MKNGELLPISLWAVNVEERDYNYTSTGKLHSSVLTDNEGSDCSASRITSVLHKFLFCNKVTYCFMPSTY